MIVESEGELIQQCRQNFGSAPRRIGQEAQRFFRQPNSLYIRLRLLLSKDDLHIMLRDHNILRDQGRVVWGFLVQANSLLFDPKNKLTSPANVIYSPDTYFDNRTAVLQNAARNLFQLKGASPQDKEMAQFARAITNELARTMRLRLPGSLCEGKEAYLTSFLIQPSHLPEGYLAAGLFPLIICPEKTPAVMILPARYWPKELRASWIVHFQRGRN